MTVHEVVRILNAKVLVEGDMETEIKTACGSDMMSDVLAFVKDQSVLLTGLMNPQVVRTAVMVDISCIVFVCGKRPDADMVKLAENYNIVFISTEMSTYEAAGRLYAAGLSA